MKRCSTCNRTYTDPTLSFCIEDGTPLTPINSADETTVFSPREVTPYQPPGSYVPPGGEGRKRRVWPWVLGIGGAFLLGIVAISIAAAPWAQAESWFSFASSSFGTTLFFFGTMITSSRSFLFSRMSRARSIAPR